jgi:hypothetical protein
VALENFPLVFGAIILIGYYKEEIGLKHFPALQDHLTDFVLQVSPIVRNRQRQKGAGV